MKLHFWMMGLTLGILTSTATLAGVSDRMQEVMEVTTDAVENFTYRFAVVIDSQGDLTGMAYYPLGGEPIHLTVQKMRSEETVLIHDVDHNLDVVKMISPQLDKQHGGRVRLTFLYSGIRKTYRTFMFDIVRNGSRWELRSVATRTRRGACFAAETFSHMFMKANKVFGQVVGISYISVN